MSQTNEYLDRGISDESAEESGYDTEAAEISRTEQRGVKRRKLSYSSASFDEEIEQEPVEPAKISLVDDAQDGPEAESAIPSGEDAQGQEVDYQIKSVVQAVAKKSKKAKKEKTPGVVYFSSLPPYLKPSALRNLLAQRGFEPITRLFLTPASKHKHNSKKSSRQLYTEGWIEFGSKKMARECAEALNAQLVGGKKGGFYHDDLWNMKYLKGMAWDELMAGIREERREEEGRRDEERRKIASETKAYVEGVDKGKRLEGMKKKRRSKTGDTGPDDDVQRLWRQHGLAKDRSEKGSSTFAPEVQSVLSKII